MSIDERLPPGDMEPYVVGLHDSDGTILLHAGGLSHSWQHRHHSRSETTIRQRKPRIQCEK